MYPDTHEVELGPNHRTKRQHLNNDGALVHTILCTHVHAVSSSGAKVPRHSHKLLSVSDSTEDRSVFRHETCSEVQSYATSVLPGVECGKKTRPIQQGLETRNTMEQCSSILGERRLGRVMACWSHAYI